MEVRIVTTIKNLLFIVPILVTGCIIEQTTYDTDDSYDTIKNDKITHENISGDNVIESKLKKANFYCESPSDCPDNVGIIYANTNGRPYNPDISQCTGFLISENIVATNSHCIPQRLKSKGSLCGGQIAIRFIGHEEKDVYNCKRIIDFSNIAPFRPDYAFFEIEPTKTTPLTIHKGGLSNNEAIKVFQVTPLNDESGGVLQSKECKVALSTVLNIKGLSSWSKTSLALGCKTVQGNSGRVAFINRVTEMIHFEPFFRLHEESSLFLLYSTYGSAIGYVKFWDKRSP